MEKLDDREEHSMTNESFEQSVDFENCNRSKSRWKTVRACGPGAWRYGNFGWLIWLGDEFLFFKELREFDQVYFYTSPRMLF